MKNITILAILLMNALVLTGCEEIVENPELEYKEKIVVRGLLKDGEPLDKISLSRSLPPLEAVPQDLIALQQKIRLQGVNASITVDGGQSYKLVEYYDTIIVENKKFPYLYYRTETPVQVKAGSSYELRVEWNGKQAYAKTFVPIPISADSVIVGEDIQISTSYYSTNGGPWEEHIDTSRYTYATGIFTPRQGEAYGATMKNLDGQNNSIDYSEEQFNEVLTAADREDDGKLRVRSNRDYQYSNPVNKADSILFRLYSYDGAYYSYYKSYDRNDLGEGAFFTGSNQRVRWNVQGDAIGIFVGFSMTSKSYPIP